MLFVIARHHDVGWQVLALRANSVHGHRSDVRHLQRTARQFAGECVLSSRGMPAGSVAVVMHSSDDGQPVSDLRRFGEQRGELQVRHNGRDRLKRTAMLNNRIRFWIPRVDV